jgi:hypothetical protein
LPESRSRRWLWPRSVSDYVRVIWIAGLVLGPMLAGGRPALAQTASAPIGAAVSRSPLLLAQAPAAAPPASAPVPEPPIGLPRVKDYESIPELREVQFDFGKSVIRADDVKVLGRERGVAARPPRLPRSDRGALRQSGRHG